MRRAAVVAVGVYLTAAVATRAAEAAGYQQCHCSSTCWCRRPLLSAFRWVAPVGHR
ncbi:hypothetical protein [uncultured Phycicoccus sp.]|uniref:hypothetical protein n=1 Tax=uncultured Phycicoccus sp. TaxID=661422 RepID=UPI00262184A2|nr:hypothetical protein [uncultured Phycicoccus sp.]